LPPLHPADNNTIDFGKFAPPLDQQQISTLKQAGTLARCGSELRPLNEAYRGHLKKYEDAIQALETAQDVLNSGDQSGKAAFDNARAAFAHLNGVLQEEALSPSACKESLAAFFQGCDRATALLAEVRSIRGKLSDARDYDGAVTVEECEDWLQKARDSADKDYAHLQQHGCHKLTKFTRRDKKYSEGQVSDPADPIQGIL
jgi:hypothetical protein